jgi:hypothetical protein
MTVMKCPEPSSISFAGSDHLEEAMVVIMGALAVEIEVVMEQFKEK